MNQELKNIISALKENQDDPYYRNKVLSRENELYQKMIGYLQNRNYENAGLALEILCMVNPDNHEYRTALNTLAYSGVGLRRIAVERGLSRQSPYFQDNFGVLTAEEEFALPPT